MHLFGAAQKRRECVTHVGGSGSELVRAMHQKRRLNHLVNITSYEVMNRCEHFALMVALGQVPPSFRRRTNSPPQSANIKAEHFPTPLLND
jgi:hypothetical protein